MQLEKKYIHKNCYKANTAVQVTLDDDYNVPDYRPDVVKIIQSSGQIAIEEVKPVNGHVNVKGKLQFRVLYLTDELEYRVSCLKGEIPIQESVANDNVEEYDKVKIQVQLEDLSVSLINSRKISIKAWIMMNMQVETVEDEEVVVAAIGEEDDRIQVRKQTMDVLQLTFQNKDTVRIREEVVLPAGKDNIQEILWWGVQETAVSTQLKENRLEVSGQLQVFVLYYTATQNSKLEWYEKSVPFSGALDVSGATEQMVSAIKIRLAHVDLETKTDSDGEERVLHIEAVLEFDVHLYEEEKLMILEDIYALDRQLMPEYEQGEAVTLLAKNTAKTALLEQVSLEAGQEAILQVCDVHGDVIVEREEKVENGLLVEGVFNLQVLYVTARDEAPLGSINAALPFHQSIEVQGMEEQDSYELDTRLNQIGLTITDNRQIEVKVSIDFELLGFGRAVFRRMKNITEEEADTKELQKRPGIVGLIAAGDELLWNIAKEYHTTLEELMEMNQLSEPVLHKGQKIMIVKSIAN